MGTLHCALENGTDLYVNERQKIRHYRARSAEEEKEEERRMPNYVNLRYIAILYTHSIGNQP